MERTCVTEDIIRQYQKHLTENEKSEATKEKYIRDVRAFAGYCGMCELTKETVIAYKQKLIDEGYYAEYGISVTRGVGD